MFHRSIRLSALVVFTLAGFAISAPQTQAAESRHRIDVDTSSLSGQTVNLFFGASGTNDGPGSATGNIAIVSNFTSDAVLQTPGTLFGLSNGDLASTLNLPFDHENNNTNVKGQLSIDAIFGNYLSFEVTLQGDQLDGSNVVPYAGFEFTLSQGFIQLWLSPSGFASAEIYQIDGTLGFESHENITITPLPIPEPTSLGMLAFGALGLLPWRKS